MCIYIYQVCVREAMEWSEEWDDDAVEAITAEALGRDPFESFGIRKHDYSGAKEQAQQLGHQIASSFPEFVDRIRVQGVLCQCTGPSYVDEEELLLTP